MRERRGEGRKEGLQTEWKEGRKRREREREIEREEGSGTLLALLNPVSLPLYRCPLRRNLLTTKMRNEVDLN